MKRPSLFKFVFSLLPLSLAPHVFSATITANPGDDLQGQVNAAFGGTLQLAAGTFNLSSPIVLPSGTTIQGSPNLQSHLVFNLPATDNTLYAFIASPNARNVTIRGVDIVSNHGVLKMMDGIAYNAIHIIANNIQFSDGVMSNGVLVFGINATIGCNDLQICWNYFHDSQKSVRNWEIWGEKNSHVDHNLFYNIADGGHYLEPTLNNTFSWNYGTYIHRMGQEIQGSGHNESGLICDHDVFYDFVNAYNDTEGMSVCPNFTTGVVVSNGYFRNSLANGATFGTMSGGAVGGPNRFGYALESICPGGLFQNNTIILSQLSADAIASGENSTANSNAVYGGSNALWGVFGPDGSPAGTTSSWTLGTGTQANTVHNDLTGAPAPPANTFAGPAIYAATNNGTLWTPTWTPPATTQEPVSPQSNNGQSGSVPAVVNAANVLPGLSAAPTTNSVVLTFPTLSNISIHTYTPSDDCGTVTLIGPATSATITNLNSGWGYSFALNGSLNGVTATGVITATTAGHSPDGTASTIATLAPPKAIEKLVTTTVFNNGVPSASQTVTYYYDGTTSP